MATLQAGDHHKRERVQDLKTCQGTHPEQRRRGPRRIKALYPLHWTQPLKKTRALRPPFEGPTEGASRSHQLVLHAPLSQSEMRGSTRSRVGSYSRSECGEGKRAMTRTLQSRSACQK